MRKTWAPYRIGKRPHKQNRAKISPKIPNIVYFLSIFDVFLGHFEGCCPVGGQVFSKGILDVTSDVVLSCSCCPSTGADYNFRREILWEIWREYCGFLQKPGNHPNSEKTLSESKGHSRSNSRNSGAFSEQLSEWLSRPNLCENPILGATLGATLGILVGRQNFSPNPRSLFFTILVAPARQKHGLPLHGHS